jgi:1-acyl-sn-glycerol-3-phosphate acyltransferase
MRTIYNTPVVTHLLRLVAKLGLRLTGWKLESPGDIKPPMVLIGAPHTSNWDCLLLVVLALELRVTVCWLGKHTLFRWPLGGFMRWVGGIPVNRTERSNQVERTAQFLRDHPDILLCVTPEGTRRKVERWKSGFYYISYLSGAPMLLTAIDADARYVRMPGTFVPTGDAEREIPAIQQLYRGYTGIVRENTFELPEERTLPE